MAKQNWEILYEDMKNNNFQTVKDDLESRQNNTKLITKTHYLKDGGLNNKVKYKVTERNGFTMDDYKKLKMYEVVGNNYDKIKENLNKVENLIEYRTYLEEKKEELDKYLNQHITRQMAENKFQENVQKLDKENEQLQAIRKELMNRLKEVSKEPDQTKRESQEAELKTEIENTDNKIKDNNGRYSELQNSQPEVKKDIRTNKFSMFSIDELKVKGKEIENKINDCNVACEMLMEGKEWNEIDTRLSKINSRVTSNEKVSNDKTISFESGDDLLKKTDSIETKSVTTGESKYKTEEEEKALIEKPKGLWAKIKGKIQEFVNKYLREDDELESELEQSTEDEIKEELKQEEKKNDSFKDKIEVSKENENQYNELKEIAEKGWKKVKTEKLTNKNIEKNENESKDPER